MASSSLAGTRPRADGWNLFEVRQEALNGGDGRLVARNHRHAKSSLEGRNRVDRLPVGTGEKNTIDVAAVHLACDELHDLSRSDSPDIAIRENPHARGFDRFVAGVDDALRYAESEVFPVGREHRDVPRANRLQLLHDRSDNGQRS